jgi:HK97 family phage major capsid protein
MSNTLAKGSLFPVELTNEMFNMVRGKSSLARLSGASPIPFNGEKVFTFNFDKEADLVAENGAKSNGGATITPVTITPVKIEYGMRVSDEFMYASEEARIQYLRAFAEGFAAKTARALDIMAFHGVNPRTGSSAASISSLSFDALVSNTVTYDSSAPQDNVVSAIALVEAAEHEVTGLAMAPAFKTALAQLKKGSSSYEAMFPELGWGATVGTINGLPADSNSTVSFGGNADKAILGNFRDYFRWGFAKEIPLKVIEYGNPDNDADAGDLQGHNQVYLRAEAYLGWGILAPGAFAIVKSGASA